MIKSNSKDIKCVKNKFLLTNDKKILYKKCKY